MEYKKGEIVLCKYFEHPVKVTNSRFTHMMGDYWYEILTKEGIYTVKESELMYNLGRVTC